MPEKLQEGNVLNWATDLDENAKDQAVRTSKLPFLAGHLALMADSHLGFGATIGSVVPTRGAIVPSCAGVDLGCGVTAVLTDLVSADLPDNLDGLMSLIGARIPAGIPTKSNQRNGSHDYSTGSPNVMNLVGWPDGTELSDKQKTTAISQCGTLGSGNHFYETCLDELDRVWIMLHSGSRGIGNQLASAHINVAKGLMARYFIELEDPDLAYLVEGTEEFDRYISDMLWAQEYALLNRETMMDVGLKSLFEVVGKGSEVDRIRCHHNYTEYDETFKCWITRKGAIKAATGVKGVIPGSMGDKSYVVSGLGSRTSYNSASHGAGRRMSRGQARKELNLEAFKASMVGKTWNSDRAETLIDEFSQAYKPIDEVMSNQRDLVVIEHTLHQVLNFKG